MITTVFQDFPAFLAVISVFISLWLLFRERRSPQSVTAWLFVIFLMPMIAVALLAIFGIRKRPDQAFDKLSLHLSHSERKDVPEIAHILAKSGASEASIGNSFEFLSEPLETYNRVLALVASAQTSIHAEFYIVANDETGRAFVEALTERAKAGVDVRLEIDSLGTLFPPRKALRALKNAGGQVRYFAPLLNWPPLSDSNLRNHRKILIIDGHTVFSGGMNIGTDYMHNDPQKTGFYDTGFIAKGPVVNGFTEVFSSDWHDEPIDIQTVEPQGDAIMQISLAGPDQRDDGFYNALLTLLYHAKKRAWLITPYFVPTEELVRAMILAQKRGVDVRLIIPRKSNHFTADAARGPAIRDLTQHIRIDYFEKGMAHAKMGIIDDMGMIGSSNLDNRSLFLNFEIMSFVYDAASVQKIENWYLEKQEWYSSEVKPKGFIGRILEKFFIILSPIL